MIAYIDRSGFLRKARKDLSKQRVYVIKSPRMFF
jgi:hypothetical protein